jgi:hypothetical protein
MKHYFTRIAGGLAVAALPLAMLATSGAASASSHIRPNATAECGAGPNCTSPDVQNSSLLNELALSHAGRRVIVAAADSSDPNQDWRYHLRGTVSFLYNLGISPMFGINAQDVFLYGSDEVYALEWAPYGRGSDKCLADRRGKAVLVHCTAAANQEFIAAGVADDVIAGATNAANPDFSAAFGISIPHADVNNHDALTARGEGRQLIFTDVNTSGSLNQYFDDDLTNTGAPAS